ncbi:ATP-binding protein [Streptomyces sp. NPDC004237]|uniref:ATP-binding protein n=1 Tax=Streptomyces sp. NPDC004237 TaxID=3154455 RepID=UPI0033B21B04
MPPTTAQLVQDQGLGQLLTHRDVALKDEAAPQRVARAEVRAILTWHASPDRVDDALLVTSELVNNSMEYAGGPVELTVDVYEHGATVSVLDCAGEDRPVLTAPTEATFPEEPDAEDIAALRTCGRGLFLVDAYATAWFVEDAEGGGKRVIAVFALPGRAR